MTRKMYDSLLAGLQDYLSQELPSLSIKWWEALVLPHISYQNQAKFEKVGKTAFIFLDLLDLLKVLERNWQSLEEKYNYPSTVFGLIKQLRLARNTYAHPLNFDPYKVEWTEYNRATIRLLFLHLNGGQYKNAISGTVPRTGPSLPSQPQNPSKGELQ